MIVLDSSAVLAIALAEPGSDKVLQAAKGALLSAANLAEVLTVAERKGIDSDAVHREILSLEIVIMPVTESQAGHVGKLWLLGRNLSLSLGDRLCLALAIDHNAEVFTSDRQMGQMQLPILITQFR